MSELELVPQELFTLSKISLTPANSSSDKVSSHNCFEILVPSSV